MKQLRYFTEQSNALNGAEKALRNLGIAKEKLHVFSKANSRRRFDGLLLQSAEKRVETQFNIFIGSFVLACLFVCLGLGGQWFSFTTAAAIILVAYPLVTFLSLKRDALAPVRKQAVDTVYFLVVEVDEKLACKVDKLASGRHGLFQA